MSRPHGRSEVRAPVSAGAVRPPSAGARAQPGVRGGVDRCERSPEPKHGSLPTNRTPLDVARGDLSGVEGRRLRWRNPSFRPSSLMRLMRRVRFDRRGRGEHWATPPRTAMRGPHRPIAIRFRTRSTRLSTRGAGRTVARACAARLSASNLPVGALLMPLGVENAVAPTPAELRACFSGWQSAGALSTSRCRTSRRCDVTDRRWCGGR